MGSEALIYVLPLLFILAVVLLLVSASEDGLEISILKIPPLKLWPRRLAGALGMFLLGLGIVLIWPDNPEVAIPPPPSTSTPPPPTGTATLTPLLPTSTPTLAPAGPLYGRTTEEARAKLKDEGVIVVGVRYDAAPFGRDAAWSEATCQAAVADPNFKPQGFDVALARQIARRILGDAEAVRFRCVRQEERVERVADGTVLLGIFFMSDVADRCQRLDCSLPYAQDGLGFMTSFNTGIVDVCGLKGKKVAIVRGTSAQYLFPQHVGTWCDFAGFNFPELIVAETREQALAWLDEGRVDAYSTSSRILDAYVTETRWVPVRSLAPENIVIGMPQGETGLRSLINLTLQALKADGSYDALYAQTFGCEDRPTDITPSATPIPAYLQVPDPLAGGCGDAEQLTDPGEHIVQAGETLGSIARDVYGNFSFWPCLKQANPGVNERQMEIGSVLEVIPLAECRAQL